MRAPGGKAAYGTADPAKVLGNLRQIGFEAIYLLKDFSRHLESPSAVRELRELAGCSAGRRSSFRRRSTP